MSLALVFTGALSDGAKVFKRAASTTDGKDLSRIIEAFGGQYTRWNAESLRRGPSSLNSSYVAPLSPTPSENRQDHAAIIPGLPQSTPLKRLAVCNRGR